MDNSFKKADTFIEHDSHDLRNVFQKIHLLKQLNQKILGYLEPNLAKFCVVANLRDGKLILIAANGSIATEIRFQTDDLLKKFRKDGSLNQIISIECKVRPPQPQIPNRLNSDPEKRMPALSPQTAEMVKTIAESIEDPKLSDVMKRIAGRIGSLGAEPRPQAESDEYKK